RLAPPRTAPAVPWRTASSDAGAAGKRNPSADARNRSGPDRSDRRLRACIGKTENSEHAKAADRPRQHPLVRENACRSNALQVRKVPNQVRVGPHVSGGRPIRRLPGETPIFGTVGYLTILDCAAQHQIV